MALMHLLTVGRSLSAMRDSGHRYKLRHGALPTFGNPPGTAPGKEFAVGGHAEKRGRRSETSERVMGKEPMTTPAVGAEAASKASAARASWLKKNLFKSARVAVPRPIVQGELSLDKVKPVRNDLSDSDLELVKPPKRPEPKPAAVEIESETVQLVKAQPVLARVLALFQRRN